MDIQELDIEAPWGKIAVKLWGNRNDPPILTVHGILDNAGSFDSLIPLLPRNFYICVDLPGHGKSSHFPSHLPIHSEDFVMVYTIVMNYFKKEKFVIMGHSYGGQLGVLYSQLYPEKVEKLILLDTIHLILRPVKYFKECLTDRYNFLLEFDKKQKRSQPPAYSYEEALDRIVTLRPFPLTEKEGKNLLKRMLVPVGDNKYNLSMDQRLKMFLNPLHDASYALETLRAFPVSCPVLIIFGKDNIVQRYLLRSILNFYTKQRNFTIRYVPGHHDVHHTNPELVAPLITEFLNQQKSKL